MTTHIVNLQQIDNVLKIIDHGEVEVEKKGNDVDLEVDWSEVAELLQELRELLQELSNKIINKTMDNFEQVMKEITEEHDLTFMAKEITEEGTMLFSSAIESSPEVKEIVETFTLLVGLAAIVSILFLREISSVGRGSTYFTALISGAVAAFYVYRLVLEGKSKTQRGSNLEGEAGN
ncbi:protein FATTY ACID EXPORT 3, chloroplastic [Trifolium repens]|nr:protein FATTY ACID EXPORT 3, chloroplastic [Trifolium repens]